MSEQQTRQDQLAAERERAAVAMVEARRAARAEAERLDAEWLAGVLAEVKA